MRRRPRCFRKTAGTRRLYSVRCTDLVLKIRLPIRFFSTEDRASRSVAPVAEVVS